MSIRCYADALAYLGKKAERPLDGRSTRLIRKLYEDVGELIAVRYHSTDVVRYYPDGTTEFTSGGWRTVTTKCRLNEYGPVGVSVWQTRGVWTVNTPKGEVDFVDGIKFTDCGWPVMPDGYEAPDTSEADAVKAVAKLVSKYIKGWCAHVEETKKIDLPYAGDCFGCQFTPSGKDFRETWRDPLAAGEPMGYSHYLSHFEEGYYVGSLLWRAVQTFGNPAVVFDMMRHEATRGQTLFLKRALFAFFRRIRPRLVAEYMGLPDHRLALPVTERGQGYAVHGSTGSSIVNGHTVQFGILTKGDR